MSTITPVNERTPTRLSPFDPRRFEHMSENDILRKIGELLATALIRRGCLGPGPSPPADTSANGSASSVDPLHLLSDDVDRQIARYLQFAGSTSPHLIGRALGISMRALSRRLARLRANGLCEVVGKTRAARYRFRVDHGGN